MGLGQGADNGRSKAPYGTACIEDEILGGGAGIGGIVFRKKGTIACHHTVAEEAQEGAAEEKGHRGAQVHVNINHGRCADIENQVRNLPSQPVAEITEHINAGNHADNGNNHPAGHGFRGKAVFLQQDHGQPHHNAVVAEVLHTGHHREGQGGYGFGRTGKKMGQGELLCFLQLLFFLSRQGFSPFLPGSQFLLHFLALHPHRRFFNAVTGPGSQERRYHAYQEKASPAIIRKHHSRQDGCQHGAGLPAHGYTGSGSGPLGSRPGFRNKGHANAVFPAQAKAGQETENIQMGYIVCKGAGSGKDGENNDGQRKGMDTAEVIGEYTEKISPQHRTDEGVGSNETPFSQGQAELTDNSRHGKRKNQHIQTVHGIADDGSPHDFPSFLPRDTGFFKLQFFQRFFRHSIPLTGLPNE